MFKRIISNRYTDKISASNSNSCFTCRPFYFSHLPHHFHFRLRQHRWNHPPRLYFVRFVAPTVAKDLPASRGGSNRLCYTSHRYLYPDCAPVRSGSSAGDAAAAGNDCCSISVGNFVDPSNHGCGEIASSPVGVPRYQQGNPCCHPGVVVVGGPAEGFGSGCEIPVALGAYTWAVPSSSFAGGNWVHCSAAVVGC